MGISRSRGDAELVKCFRETIQTTGLNLYVGLIPVVNCHIMGIVHNSVYTPYTCIFASHYLFIIYIKSYWEFCISMGILHFS